jgi:hypothetical protein
MKAMINTGKSIMNALAFANVNRIDELQAQLDHMTADASGNLAQSDRDPPSTTQSAFAPSIGHVQGAL